MGKKNLTSKKETIGMFIRINPELKKKAQLYAINNNTNLTSLIVENLENLVGQMGQQLIFIIMKNPFKQKNMFTDSKIELIEPNYEGIAKVLAEFEKITANGKV